MRKEFLSFSPASLTDGEIEEVVHTLKAENPWLSSGPKTQAFEESFCRVVGAPGALALNSCTAGLHVALLTHGIGAGDEVITTPMTFCASANVIEHVGAKVVLADVEPDTLLIDTKNIERAITSKTKAIMPVHYAGHPADMDTINAIANKHGLAVVEDAAHCMPSKIGDKWVGSSENLTAFSFYATKNITTGEGGMLTGNKELLGRARMLALHGLSRGAWNRYSKGGSWRYDVPEPGFKYNMSDIQASIGLVQLKRLDELYERRMAVVKFYQEAFDGNPFISTLKVKSGYQSSWHLFVLFLNLEKLKIDRDQFTTELQEANIGCSVHFIPVHLFSHYSKKYGWQPDSFPVANAAFNRMLSIPLNSKMSLLDAADVVEAVNTICRKFAK